MKSAPDVLAAELERNDGPLLIVTGAGVSRASGIRTFRGSEPDAVWKTSDMEMATRRYFQKDPVEQWKWYLSRFEAVDAAEPNPAHVAIAEIERWHTARGGRFLLVTQNIDTLHERAGSVRLIKVHGSADRLRCVRDGCPNASPRGSIARQRGDLEAFRDRPGLDTLPRCPLCHDLLRVHVLLFDELYEDHLDYRFRDVVNEAWMAERMLFIGTSFAVGITDLLLRAARERAIPVFSIDPAGSRAPLGFDVTDLPHEADVLLPRVVDRITG
jgi:NAD-dependent deacetylase